MMKGSGLFFLSFWILGTPTLWAQTVSKNISVSFEIEPVTVLKANSESGVSAVRLGPVSPGTQVPNQTLTVSIVTNTRQRYRVYHELRGEVTSSEGISFPQDQLLFMATAGTQGGASQVPSFIPVPQGEISLFTSKSEGGPDSFQILYSLENKKLFSAGLYYGNISLDLRTE